MVGRVSDRATFEALRRRAGRARCGAVTAAYCAADDPPMARVAYTVGRRAGNAVTRNRIRRRLRAAVGEIDAAGGLPPGAYMVWAGSEVVRLPFETLKESVARAMTSAAAPRSP